MTVEPTQTPHQKVVDAAKRLALNCWRFDDAEEYSVADEDMEALCQALVNAENDRTSDDHAERPIGPRHLHQRDEDGYPVGADDIMRVAYGPIPEATEFQHGKRSSYEEPAEVHGWQWSNDFGRWSALVTFEDGWHGFTYPAHPHVSKLAIEERSTGTRGK